MRLLSAARQHKSVSEPIDSSKLNNRPLVGILTQAGLEEDKFVPKDGSYIAASYVKFVESGGARVVPILADTPPDVVSRKLLVEQFTSRLVEQVTSSLWSAHTVFRLHTFCSALSAQVIVNAYGI